MVNDKDVSGVLAMMPKDAIYYFTKASVKRALSEEALSALGKANYMQGKDYPNVHTATKAALEAATENDLIFVGGSSFIVADLLARKDELPLNIHN
jgi:dihydrofolate synthase/folylpolyglutamate synthase